MNVHPTATTTTNYECPHRCGCFLGTRSGVRAKISLQHPFVPRLLDETKKRKTPDYKRFWNEVDRHKKNANLHPNCHADCPARTCLKSSPPSSSSSSSSSSSFSSSSSSNDDFPAATAMDLEESENRRTGDIIDETTALKRKIASLEEENRNQSARIESLEEERATLSARIETLEGQTESLEADIDSIFEARIEPLEEENRKQSARMQQLFHYFTQRAFTLSEVLPLAYISPTEELVTSVIEYNFSRPPTFKEACCLFIAVVDPSQHPSDVIETLNLSWFRHDELWSIERSQPVAPSVWTKVCNLFCPLLTERLASIEGRIDAEWAAYTNSPDVLCTFFDLYSTLSSVLGKVDHLPIESSYDASFLPTLGRLFRAKSRELHPDKHNNNDAAFKELSNAMSDMQALYSLDHLPCSKEFAVCKDLYHLMHRQAWSKGLRTNKSGVCDHGLSV